MNYIIYTLCKVNEDYEAPEEERINNFFNICISDAYQIHTRIRQVLTMQDKS